MSANIGPSHSRILSDQQYKRNFETVLSSLGIGPEIDQENDELILRLLRGPLMLQEQFDSYPYVAWLHALGIQRLTRAVGAPREFARLQDALLYEIEKWPDRMSDFEREDISAGLIAVAQQLADYHSVTSRVMLGTIILVTRSFQFARAAGHSLWSCRWGLADLQEACKSFPRIQYQNLRAFDSLRESPFFKGVDHPEREIIDPVMAILDPIEFAGQGIESSWYSHEESLPFAQRSLRNAVVVNEMLNKPLREEILREILYTKEPYPT